MLVEEYDLYTTSTSSNNQCSWECFHGQMFRPKDDIRAKEHNIKYEEGLWCNVNLHMSLESNGEGNSIVASGFK